MDRELFLLAASDRNDIRSLWQYGYGSNYGNHIDVVAPGTDIWSTFPYTNNYVSWNGTSMAAPFVSGIASLLLSVNPNLYNDDIEQIIRISADEVAGMGGQEWTTEYGTGRVNAKKAIEYLQTPYTLLHKSASGGSEHSHTGYFLLTFYGVAGIANGTYYVKRYDVRKTVNWSETLEDVHVWGRGVGVGTNGYSLTNPNFAMGWGEVISHNNSSATLRTYVYDVWERGTWRHVGWKPTSPSNVSFNYH